MPGDLYDLRSAYGGSEELKQCINEMHKHDLLVSWMISFRAIVRSYITPFLSGCIFPLAGFLSLFCGGLDEEVITCTSSIPTFTSQQTFVLQVLGDVVLNHRCAQKQVSQGD